MPDFEKGNYSKEAYDQTAESEASLRAEIAAAAASGSTDTILELSTRLQTLGAKKGEMIGQAKEEAEAEDTERNTVKEKEAAHGEALGMNSEFDQVKVAEDAAREKARVAEKTRVQAEEDAAKLAEARAKIHGEKSGETITSGVERTIPKTEDTSKEMIESIYGMDIASLAKLIQSRGDMEGEKLANIQDPKKNRELYNQKLAFKQEFQRARVRLFDRVLSGEAAEAEMKIAEGHAAEQAEIFGLEGFHSAVPKAWYTNERIAKAMAEISPRNKAFVDHVGKNYSNEELRKQFEKIEEDGSVGRYERA